MLHVTSGDVLAERIRASRVPGEVVAWRDALHLGPVPAGMDARRLAEVRARFLAGRGWGAFDALLDDLAARDAALESASRDVVLWFGSDLADQLRQVQVLDRLGPRRSALVQVDGLDRITPEDVAELFRRREPVGDETAADAARAWTAFRAPDPTGLHSVTGTPYLDAALRRHLEEFPSVIAGLSRTERGALAVLDERPRGPVELFRAMQKTEPRPFLSDVQFWDLVADLTREPEPLLSDRHRGGFARPPDVGWDGFRSQSLAVTGAGRAVLAGSLDRAELQGVDRWHGGVRLSGRTPAWRWDPDAARIIPARGR